MAAMVLIWSAAWIDFRTHKIPNVLTVSAVLIGFLIHTVDSGLLGLWQSLAGFSLALIFLLPGYALGATAAGDVKLMGALGSLLGPSRIICALVHSILLAGIIGLVMAVIAWRIRGATGPLKRYREMFWCLALTGKPVYIKPEAGEAMARRMPLAVPIAIGTTISLLFPIDMTCSPFR
jgi:prepilin peptidase CpaA